MSAEETEYANLTIDPRMTALEEGTLLDISYWERNFPKDAHLEALRAERKKYDEDLEVWMVSYSEYLDQFQTEICMTLRRGELSAIGTKVASDDLRKSVEISETEETGLTDLEETEIPKERWISHSINWEDSAIFGREECFVWILVKTEDMLRIFPPSTLIKSDLLVPIGANFAVALPHWDRCRSVTPKEGDLPCHGRIFTLKSPVCLLRTRCRAKKRSGQQIQDWFMKIHGKSVSRAAIGERLKPYFDQLIKE